MKPRPLPIMFFTILAALSCGGETTAPPIDRTHPTAPSGLVATQISRAHVRLNWLPSTDNVAVTGYTTSAYDVNDGRYIATISSTGTDCVDTLAIPWEPMRYNVVAWDAAENGQTSGFITFTVKPTAADVAGVWGLAACDPGYPNGLYDDVCAENMTFELNPDSTVNGMMTNLLLVVPKDTATYGKLVIATASFSGRFTGRSLHLEVMPASGTDWTLTGGTFDLIFLPRPPAGGAWRLRHLRGDYSFTGSAYSYDFQWHNAFNSGTISFVR